jgi:hypothetical protein
MTLHPMSQFDPSKPCIVHDRAEGMTIAWSPDWAPAYSRYAREYAGGLIDFDGLVLDGWTELPKISLPPDCVPQDI